MKIVLVVFILFSVNGYSRVLLKDIGVIGLMSHDLFAWDHNTEKNTENGLLDLSTIFDYDDGKRWKKGGNPKNGENPPVWSVTKRLVNFFQNELSKHKSNNKAYEIARKETVFYFYEMVRESFERLSGLSFPSRAIDEKVNNIEQAALRAMHDILPGQVKLYRSRLFPLKKIKLTNFFTRKLYLTDTELNQEIANFDGDYDIEYQNIKIPFAGITLDLKEIDRKFIEKFSPYKQASMLQELKMVGEGKLAIDQVSFIHHIEDLVSKAMCSKNNHWVPKELLCI